MRSPDAAGGSHVVKGKGRREEGEGRGREGKEREREGSERSLIPLELIKDGRRAFGENEIIG